MVSERSAISVLEASAAFAPPAVETPACASFSFTKSRLALSPSPSKVAPDCPPRSDMSSYASLMALNFSMLASGLRSGCSVAMSRRYTRFTSEASSSGETPSTPAARALWTAAPACASRPSTAFSKLPQSSTPNSKSETSTLRAFEPAMAAAIASKSEPRRGTAARIAGTPSICSAETVCCSVSGMSMLFSLKNLRASYCCLSATMTSHTGSQSLRTGSGSASPAGLCLTESTYSRYWSRSSSRTMRSYALPCFDTTSRIAAAAFLRAASFACLLTAGAAFFFAAFAAFFSSLDCLLRPA
mmetsp:Transcript_7686/g.32050  ORF Transcript_7686/g.32050 Transcript_7686/m.32050 type:complete len:300 (+) Transcript_7686:922-1821(+)